LDKGRLTYRIHDKETELTINGGFVEAKKNNVSVCVE
jgi:F0F1-type ATP synthase epsilon subunit